MKFSKKFTIKFTIKSFLSKLISSPQGFTLVEIMVAIGLAGVLAVGGMKISQTMNRSSKAVSQRFETTAVYNEIRALLAYKENCTQTFSGKSPDSASFTLTDIKQVISGAPIAKYPINTTIGNNEVQVTSYSYIKPSPPDFGAADETGTFRLTIDIARVVTTENMGADSVTKDITIWARVNSSTRLISECKAMDSIGDDDWKPTSAPAYAGIYYTGGQVVGVGIDQPGHLLHVHSATGTGEIFISGVGAGDLSKVVLSDSAAGTNTWSLKHSSTHGFSVDNNVGAGSFALTSTGGTTISGTGATLNVSNAGVASTLSTSGLSTSAASLSLNSAASVSSARPFSAPSISSTSTISAATSISANSAIISGNATTGTLTANTGSFVNLTASNPSFTNLSVSNLSVGGNGTFGGTVTASSDRRLKKSIENLDEDFLSAILSLSGKRFQWKKDEKYSVGLIAQEVEKVFPEAVATDNKGFKYLAYDMFIAPLLDIVKKQQKKMDVMQTQLNSQERELEIQNARIEALEKKLIR